MELRDEEFPELQKVHPDEPMAFATDCVIDTDFALLIPDTYVENVSERIRLYRELDNIRERRGFAAFRDRDERIALVRSRLRLSG